MNGVVIGGTASGVGTTLAVVRALAAADREVQPANSGTHTSGQRTLKSTKR